MGADFNGVLSQEKIDIAQEIEIELTAEEYVNKYFSDVPVLIAVAKCESQFRQHNKREQTLRGEVNEFDLGVMQINEMYHEKRADKLGLDLHTIEGNTAYARYLFEKEGLKPWSSSSRCWKKSGLYTSYVKELAMK